jgi:RsiW-degrading membrane proteinase PrsW (M82 family)
LRLGTFLSRLLQYCAGDIDNHFVLFEIAAKFFLVAICLDFLFNYSLVDSMTSLISILLIMFYLMIKLYGNLLTPSMLEDLGYEMYLLS